MMRKFSFLFALLVSLGAQAQIAPFQATEIKVMDGYPEYVLETRYSPFGSYFAITIGENTTEVYDRYWKKVYTHQGDPRAVGSTVTFSPDEKYIVIGKFRTAGDIGVVRLDDGTVSQVLDQHQEYVNRVVYRADGKYMASCSSDDQMVIWKWENGKFSKHQVFDEYEDGVADVAFSADGNYLVAAGTDKKISIYAFNKKKYVPFQEIGPGEDRYASIAYHPEKEEFVVAKNSAFEVYELKGKQFALKQAQEVKAGSMYSLAYSPKGEYFVTPSSYQAAVYVWSTSGKNYENIETIRRHRGTVFSANFSNDGQTLVTTSKDASAIFWKVKGVQPSDLARLAKYHNDPFTKAQVVSLTPAVQRSILEELGKELTAPQNEFETSAEYLARESKLHLTTQRLVSEAVEKHFGLEKLSNGRYRIPQFELIRYNADQKIYKIRFMDTEAGIKIPLEMAKALKANPENGQLTVQKVRGKKTSYKAFKLTFSKKDFSVLPLENPLAFETGRTVEDDLAQADGVSKEVKKAALESMNAGTNYALLFATDEYASFGDLVNPINDAQTVAKELEENYGIQVEIVRNAGQQQMLGKLREYAKKTYQDNDQLFIFFAGHGYFDKVFKEGYLVCGDSRNDDATLTTFVSHSNLRTIVNNLPCKHIFLAMDVCFGGTFDPKIAQSTHRSASMYDDVSKGDFVKRKMKFKTRYYLTSGGKEYVPDGRPGQHSPFTRKLLEALRNFGGEDKVLTVAELLQFVEKVVPQPRFGEFGENEPGSDFLFMAK